ncbi:amidase [Niveispirillum sp. KHB5.9]|uniref:amidase n=1 Tax=Niveispirillum sp. KHB5.9 TaxID=3400269 RepID=UPI003A8353E6
MIDPCDLGAVPMLAAFRQRTLSPLEVMRSVLDRMQAAEPLLAATWAPEPEAALTAARASEARWFAGRPLGPLDGVPVTIKELIATKGYPKPLGTAATELVPSVEDAPPAARMREAGAIIFARTTVPDYGMLSSGLSSFHRLSRNPWDVTRNPGGSSAGAAAAAAAGYGPLHVGTDIGGSVRLPAGWCGIYALKPSNGRVPIDPPYYGRIAGPMTRSVADSALMMAVLSRPDERDHMSLPPADLPWQDLAIDMRGLRIGLMLEAGCGLAVDPAITQAVQAAAQAFSDAGAIVEPVGPVISRQMLDGLDRFWRTRFLYEMEKLPPERQERILPYIRDWVAAARDYSAMDVYTGQDQMLAMKQAARDVFDGFDFILSPTSPVPTYPAEWASPLNDPARPFEHIGFTVAWNMSDHPAASINCGYMPDGMPIGLQIVGRRFDDVGVLRLSRFHETIRPAQRPWPTPWRQD